MPATSPPAVLAWVNSELTNPVDWETEANRGSQTTSGSDRKDSSVTSEKRVGSEVEASEEAEGRL